MKMSLPNIKEGQLRSMEFSLERTKEMLARSIQRWRGKKVPDTIMSERRGMRSRIEWLKEMISRKED